MIHTIILLTLIVIGVIIYRKNQKYFDNDWEILGAFMVALFSIFLIIHLLVMSTVSYEFESFVTRRNSFQQTLNVARSSNDNPYEIAAITEKIAEWNDDLAMYQFKNTKWFFDPYIDDRIDTLNPIQ